jgi:hypothetical protein
MLPPLGAGLRLWHPVRPYYDFLFWILRIIGYDMHAEVMLTIHTFVHHELQFDSGFFAWVECRPTDDSTGRSATLQDFDTRLTGKGKLGVADVLDVEHRLDRRAQLHITVVKLRRVDGGAGGAGHLRRVTRLGLLSLEHQSQCGHYQNGRRSDKGCPKP